MWFVSIIVALVIGAAVVWIRNKGIPIRWYEWLLGAITILLLGMSVQHYVGSIREYETTAAGLGLAVFGGLTVLFGAVTFILVWRRQRAS